MEKEKEKEIKLLKKIYEDALKVCDPIKYQNKQKKLSKTLTENIIKSLSNNKN